MFLEELINNTKWTDDVYEQNERLTGTIQITIEKENSTTSFTGKLAIQLNRPVYGAEYTTPLFTHLDNEVAFSYEQFQPLQFSRNTFSENLTSTLSYYVYVMLGMTYDSYAPQGGEAYWQIAQDIYNVLPDGAKSEWKGKELDNQRRYWFVENILSPRLKGFRQGIYDYHRLGLDYASTDMARCKAAITQALDRMDEAQQAYPNTRVIRTFSVTKTAELIDIYKAATQEQKTKFIALMSRLDPANSSKFTEVGF